MSEQIMRLHDRVTVEPRCDGEHVDCRLLFMGDRGRELVRAYAEAIHRLSVRRDADARMRYLGESDEIRQYYQIRRHGDVVEIELRDAVFREPASLDDLTFELHISDDAHEQSYALPLERFAALGRLLPMLSRGTPEGELTNRLNVELGDADAAWALHLLGRLEQAGFVQRDASPIPSPFPGGPQRPRVTFVGHTALLVQSNTTMVAFDPLLRHGQGMYHEGRHLSRLPLGAICCSHSHWDHCDVASLLLFDKQIPIVVPRVIRPTVFNPPIVPMLRLLGFADIREVGSWESLRIGDIEVVTVPFHGEQDEPGAEIDHYTYVVRTDGLTLYGGVDAFRDTFGDMLGALDRVRREYQPNVAFLPISRLTYAYRHGGVNGFCRRMDTTLLDQSFQYTAGPDAAVEWVRQLGVSWVAPYATFTFSKSAPAPQVAEFARELAAAGMRERLLALRPRDAFTLDDLGSNVRARMRRNYLNRWLDATTAVAGADRALSRHVAYRGIRRLFRSQARPDAGHHH